MLEKVLSMKRFHARARGRGARILKPFSHLTIILSEEMEEKMGQKTKPLGFRLGVNRTWDPVGLELNFTLSNYIKT